jgi:threonine dehydrogenase-like Zn-dependent dehydrogenase
MKALCWCGNKKVQVETVPDPHLINPRDIIVKVTSTAICGSDLHIYHGYIPTMQKGDILGHEFMGEVVDKGPRVTNLHIGDRVIIPFTISCGACEYCVAGKFSLCDNSNPNADKLEKAYGYSGSGLFGYSHLYGGYAGGQAEYVRVPFADVGAFRVPSDLDDEKVLFLTDIFPTGYMAAENCEIKKGDTVAVWGCGPVGQFAIQSAFLLGAERVIAIDHIPARLQMTKELSDAEVINYEESNSLIDELRERTGGRGPDACIDAVGMEAHGKTLDAWYDRIKQAVKLETDRPSVFRQTIQACKKGGVLSLPGVYGGLVDKMPFGAAFAKGLTIRMGQTHVHQYLPTLLEHIESGRVDPSEIITHRFPLEKAAEAYEVFSNKEENCVKVVLKP